MKAYIAGGITTGYVLIKIDGRKYKAHRLAWLYVHGEWPAGDLDHINGCPLDNRISNLRIATNPQNQANRRRDRGKETPKGVRVLPSGRYQARISVNKQLHHLGTFDTAEQAQQAYADAARHYYQDFARAA
ncbi:HNH endonuclease signature motif containing protein [Xanthomonas sp. NCPPB 3443]|uniref:HNH endonuclease signature motif containing protein n=1 Tax=Xanthomonas sp. NCPPB 3443 TaxID=3243407 RepID=UPI003555E5D1